MASPEATAHLLPVFLIALAAALPFAARGQIIDKLDYRILEGLEADNQVANIATDSKLSDRYSESEFAKLRYSILDNPEDSTAQEYFAIGESTGMLTLLKSLDRDTVCKYKNNCEFTLDVAVRPAQYFQVITVKIIILDVNDNRPVFPSAEFYLNIPESSAPGTYFSVPAATDPDGPQYGIKRYEISPAFGSFELHYESDSSEINLELMDRLDREQVQHYTLRISAIDGGSPALSASLLVNVTVTDVNDNPPVFNTENYFIRVQEESSIPQTLIRVKAEDVDAGINALVTYGMTQATFGEIGEYFEVKEQSGDIVLIKQLDRETQSSYRLVVTARDGGQGSRVASATVTVSVDDVNDNSPMITVSTLTEGTDCEISEDADVGTFVGFVSVTDRDVGSNGDVNCRLQVPAFTLEKISQNRYKIVTRLRLDREARDEYSLVLECYDSGSPQRTSREIVKVKVIDANDHSPAFNKRVYRVDITENNNVDQFIVQVNATDGDAGSNARISYAILNDDDSLFRLDPDTGVIRATAQLDHERANEIRLRVRAMDHGNPSRSSEATVAVSVKDVNDSPPKFESESYTFVNDENQPANFYVGTVHALDPDSAPYNDIEYSFFAESLETMQLFAMDSNSGKITSRKSFDRETNTVYYLTAMAINEGYPGMTGSVSVTVYVSDKNDNTPIIDFPSSFNNTVHISNMLPPGERVTQILAHDLDTGDNADISFSIELIERDGGNQVYVNDERRSPFGVNTQSGDVFVSVELSYIEYEQFDLRVKVTDHGAPSRFVTSNLSIIVNKSLAFLGPGLQRPMEGGDDSGGLNSSNMIIVIAVVATTAVLVIILSAAITLVLVKSRRSKKTDSYTESHSSNGDDFSMKDSYKAAPRPDSQIVGGYTYTPANRNSSHIHADEKANNTKENPLSTSARPYKYDLSYVNIPSYTSDTSSNNTGTGPGVTYISAGPSQSTIPIRYPGDKLQPGRSSPHEHAHNQLDIDAASSSSGDVSNTDSGRGPSELGSGEGHQDAENGNAEAGDNKKKVRTGSAKSAPRGNSFSSNASHPANPGDRGDRTHDEGKAPTGQSNPTSGSINRQTVRNVKARDKHKRDYAGYPAPPSQTDIKGAGEFPNFRDASSMLGYKSRNPTHSNIAGSRCSSDFTDATSTTSATSGSYVIGADDLELELARLPTAEVSV